MTKNAGTDMCSFDVDQAVQIHGGNGYMREYSSNACIATRALTRSAEARARS